MKEFFQGFHIKLAQYISYNSKELVTNPQWIIMRRMGRFNAIRKWKAESFTSYKAPSTQQTESSIFTNLNIDNVIANLEKYGLYQGSQLPEHIINNILKFAYSTNCYAGKNPKQGFHIHEKDKAQAFCKQKILVGKYFNTALQCQAINMLQNDLILQEIAAKYLKTKPVHISNSLF